MLVSRIMQSRVSTVGPRTSIHAAAALMADRDIGMLPVVVAGRAVGVVTDRDIVIRLLPETDSIATGSVEAVMTHGVRFCRPDQSVAEAARMMGDWRVRRLVVGDGDGDGAGRILGIVSLGDIARDASEELAGQALGEILEWR